jgi:hypothetical protein
VLTGVAEWFNIKYTKSEVANLCIIAVFLLTTLLLLVTSIFMTLPIVRIWNALRNNPSLQMKERKMIFYLVLFFVMVLTYVASAVILITQLITVENLNMAYYNYVGVGRCLLESACNFLIMQNCHEFTRTMNDFWAPKAAESPTNRTESDLFETQINESQQELLDACALERFVPTEYSFQQSDDH